ncbi:hypothetical protein LTR09_000467 [Extremus antarcticus]|uniref:Heterokaryon incompatibility domain-containing protein n=1 Tax=Extremus antarcticus TaxID=702011 RepID=A0AAJ0LXC9_9PEZI|nr:hypothetical protein LTR09_000467 [Extremus antarcticus]
MVLDFAPYFYESIPNGWTRLLTLDPGASEDARSGQLAAVPIDPSCITGDTMPPASTKPQCLTEILYQAVSYCWGTQSPTEFCIICDGARLPIPENLRNALHRFRFETGTRLLWCDAICIDQTNMSEKAQQVHRMDTVFSEAEQVLAWVGDEMDVMTDLTVGLDAVRRLADCSRTETTEFQVPHYAVVIWIMVFSTRKTSKELVAGALGLQEILSLFDDLALQTQLGILCFLPWFRRAWIM